MLHSAQHDLSILHATAPARVGGLESVVCALATGQARAGHEVQVVASLSLADTGHPFVEALRANGVEVREARLPGRAYLREKSLAGEWLDEIRPDVVHTHGYRPDVLIGGLARRRGIPIVTTVHGFTGGDWKNRLYEHLQRRAYRRFDAVVAVSGPLQRELRAAGVPDRSLHLVQNAWTPASPSPDRRVARETLALPETGFVVGWVGRLTPEKGAALLLQSAAELGDLPLTVSVIGDGPELADLRRTTERLGLGDRVRWHGSVAGAGRLFQAFDCFVLSSHTEGTPIVLFEAMDAGVPIVATSVGGVPDVLSDEEALLVAPDDPRGLARAVRDTYADRASAEARAGRARRRLGDDFAVEPWLARYDTIYREAIRHRREGGRKK